MRKALLGMGILAIVGLGAGMLMAQHVATQGAVAPTGDYVQPVQQGGGCGCTEAADCGCRRCGRCGDSYGCSSYCRAEAAQACFNCSCKGSYKFPVPPQYTYHWPGMYSQQTMTEYNSPYRFPPLELPKWDQSKPAGNIADKEPPVRQTSALVRSVNH